ncbi:hypothetical protein J0B02_14715, partial [Enterobacteriaceae bacterium YMB-R22]|uniref:hypothetical protein n=1 Tax=Tenebrionicola larvae TaxID=2815733 RepID=UPI0037DA67F9|nr:hypothetical protein [Tenebrionicola larvae]
SSGITARSDRMNITVDYHQTNRKTDTGKTLKRWPVLVDHYKHNAARGEIANNAMPLWLDK